MDPKRQRFGEFLIDVARDYGSKVIGEVTLDQVYGGARGIKSLVWEVRVHTPLCNRVHGFIIYRARSLIQKRVSASVARLYRSARNYYRRHLVEVNHYQKVCAPSQGNETA